MNRPTFLASLAAAFGALPFVKVKQHTDWDRIVEIAETDEAIGLQQQRILNLIAADMRLIGQCYVGQLMPARVAREREVIAKSLAAEIELRAP